MNGRLYDPQLGRFLSPDPIFAAPGSSQSWNSYSYVSNSPLSYVDPGGQFQAGIGCNVGYEMCMNGGNTSGGGGGGSGHGTETVTVKTFNVHTGVNFAQVHSYMTHLVVFPAVVVSTAIIHRGSSLQAQIELTISGNLPRNSILEIDLDGLRNAGYVNPDATRVKSFKGLPGGGYEIKFPYALPPE